MVSELDHLDAAIGIGRREKDIICRIEKCMHFVNIAVVGMDDYSKFELAIEAAFEATPEGLEKIKLKRSLLKYRTVGKAIRGENVGMMQIMAALSEKEKKLTYPLQTMWKKIIGKG